MANLTLEVTPAALCAVLTKLSAMLELALSKDADDQQRLAAIALRQEFRERIESMTPAKKEGEV